MTPAEPQPRHWFRRTALALTLAMAAVGAFLLATADYSDWTDKWITVSMDGSFDGPHFVQGWYSPKDNDDPRVPVRVEAIVPRWRESFAQDTILQALAELQRLLVAANPDIPGSDIERLVAAQAGERVLLSVEVVEMLRNEAIVQAHARHQNDQKISVFAAFDEALSNQFELGENYAVKKTDNLRLDHLPRVARYYAIDKAIARMKSLGVADGVIRVGDDIRRFGRLAE